MSVKARNVSRWYNNEKRMLLALNSKPSSISKGKIDQTSELPERLDVCGPRTLEKTPNEPVNVKNVLCLTFQAHE
jgi:hypothetical protein